MKKLTLTSLVFVLFAMGCPAKKDARVVTTNPNAAIAPNTTGTFTNTCQPNQFKIGTIYDSGQQQASLYSNGSFEQNVKSFLSAAINPQEIGTISGGQWDNTGMRFEGVIKLDTSGQVVLAQSRMIMKVYDSLILQNSSLQAMTVQMNTAAEGKFDLNTGTGYAVFKDNYGEVRFDGRFDAQNFSGTVSYKNYASFDNSQPAQGQLGQFLIARCVIIQ